jgi:hypothetical protein
MMRRRRPSPQTVAVLLTVAAVVAAISSHVVPSDWVWWQCMNAPRTPDEDPVLHAVRSVATFLSVATAVALIAAVIAGWIAGSAVARDGAERVLALETASLHGPCGRLGAAMRAELASIDDPGQRSLFARSAAAMALRRGTGPWPAVLAVAAGVGAAVVVFMAARISFGRPRDRGIIGEPTMGLVMLLLVGTVIAGTLIGRSFRAGLETAVLSWLAVYVCTVAVEIPLAIAWYIDDGILLLDGEGAANSRVDAIGAALQPITHYAFIVMSVSQFVIAVMAAGFGAMALHAARRFGMLLHDTSTQPSSG